MGSSAHRWVSDLHSATKAKAIPECSKKMHGLMPNLARRRGRRKLEHIFDPAIGRWEIKLGGHRAYTFDLLQLMYKDLRDLPIQERKAYLKEFKDSFQRVPWLDSARRPTYFAWKSPSPSGCTPNIL